MNTKSTIIGIVAIIIAAIIAFLAFSSVPASDAPSGADQNSEGANGQISEGSEIEGCYAAITGKDVYTLDIQSVDEGRVTAFLSFKNFEKDSSSGSLVGTYANDILLGDYSFESEGMSSVRQVIFKKTPDGFIEGFGPVTYSGNRSAFADITDVSYEKGIMFKAGACI